jgi:hypothetical protein
MIKTVLFIACYQEKTPFQDICNVNVINLISNHMFTLWPTYARSPLPENFMACLAFVFVTTCSRGRPAYPYMSSRGYVHTTGGTELFPFYIFSGNLSFTTLGECKKSEYGSAFLLTQPKYY